MADINTRQRESDECSPARTEGSAQTHNNAKSDIHNVACPNVVEER